MLQPRQAFFAPTAIPQSLPLEWRTPSSLPLEGFAVLNDTPVACQTRGPTRRETGAPISRRRQPPPTHCGASRRNGRDLIIANPVEANTPTVAGQAVAEASAPVNAGTVLLTDSDDRCTPPASTHRQIRTCPPRAKGSLNRRFEWFSLVTFFLQKKKVTRAGARNAPACARRRNTCLSPRQGSLET